MFTKEEKTLFRFLNKFIRKWNKYGGKPMILRKYENLLEQFYEWSGKTPKEDNVFNLRVKLNEDQQDEFFDIAYSFAQEIEEDTLRYDPDDLYGKFLKAQGKHGIETLQDYVDFIDQKTIFSKEQVISSSMSYYEYEKLMERARTKGVSQETLNQDITRMYLIEGLKGDALYEFIYKNL